MRARRLGGLSLSYLAVLWKGSSQFFVLLQVAFARSMPEWVQNCPTAAGGLLLRFSMS